MPSTLAELEAGFKETLKPGTTLEGIFASEIAYAAWELQRVRDLSNIRDAAPALNAAYARASRNWTRARKELKRLQTARLNHLLHVEVGLILPIMEFPMADPARVPAPKPASAGVLAFSSEVAQYRAMHDASEVK